MSQRWKPIYGVLKDCKRPVNADDKAKYGNKIKFVHQCSICKDYFPKKLVEVDHIIACGPIQDIAVDVGPFILRLLCERDGLRVLCHECHLKVTNGEIK